MRINQRNQSRGNYRENNVILKDTSQHGSLLKEEKYKREKREGEMRRGEERRRKLDRKGYLTKTAKKVID